MLHCQNRCYSETKWWVRFCNGSLGLSMLRSVGAYAEGASKLRLPRLSFSLPTCSWRFPAREQLVTGIRSERSASALSIRSCFLFWRGRDATWSKWNTVRILDLHFTDAADISCQRECTVIAKDVCWPVCMRAPMLSQPRFWSCRALRNLSYRIENHSRYYLIVYRCEYRACFYWGFMGKQRVGWLSVRKFWSVP